MGDITGTTFAGYEVRDVVAVDLVSTLYRAFDPEEERTVSLRIISQDLCGVEGADRDLYRRFRTEAKASLTFEHEHSPTVEEVGEHRGQGYLVAPFLDAAPLSEVVKDAGPPPLDAALDLLAPVADALDSAESAGLTHGAVSPSTVVFVRADGGRPRTAHVTGFGVGALLELRLKRDRKHLTVTDDLLYVAPEHLRQQPLTGRADQYALACAFVHLVTGQPPFLRDSIGGLFGAHLFVEPELDPGLPWARAVRKALAKEPDERFDSCAEMLAALRSRVPVLVAPMPDGVGTPAAGATVTAGRAAPPVAREGGRPRERGATPVRDRAAVPVRDREAVPVRDGEAAASVRDRSAGPARDRSSAPAGRGRTGPPPQEPAPAAPPPPEPAPAESRAAEPAPPVDDLEGEPVLRGPLSAELDPGPGAPEPDLGPPPGPPLSSLDSASPPPPPGPRLTARPPAGGPGGTMAFDAPPPSRSSNGAGPAGLGHDDDAPLLSEVLSQHDRFGGRGGGVLESPGVRLALLLVALAIVAGLAVWFIGS